MNQIFIFIRYPHTEGGADFESVRCGGWIVNELVGACGRAAIRVWDLGEKEFGGVGASGQDLDGLVHVAYGVRRFRGEAAWPP